MMIQTFPSEEAWTQKDIDNLERFFSESELPATVRLNSFSVVSDVKLMISEHLKVLRSQPVGHTFKHYYNRLTYVKNLIERRH
jgi:hypothetical protein